MNLIRLRQLAVGAMAVPFLPARLLWMRAVASFERAAEDGAIRNALQALTEETEAWRAVEAELRQLSAPHAELTGAGRL